MEREIKLPKTIEDSRKILDEWIKKEEYKRKGGEPYEIPIARPDFKKEPPPNFEVTDYSPGDGFF